MFIYSDLSNNQLFLCLSKHLFAASYIYYQFINIAMFSEILLHERIIWHVSSYSK